MTAPIGKKMNQWRDLSIVFKLYSVVGIMAVLVCCELLTLRFAMHTLSSVRAFVSGEGLWSKAQKNAVLSLVRFGHDYPKNLNESGYEEFLKFLKVQDGDHRARLELGKNQPRFKVIENGFLDGQVHRDDIPGMIDLIRRFHSVLHIARALQVWEKGDVLIENLKESARRYHDLLIARVKDPKAIDEELTRIYALNDQLTQLEDEFSFVLGAGSRWLEKLIFILLVAIVFTVACIGVLLTVTMSRHISRSLKEMSQAAQSMSRGDFSKRLEVHSSDELGQVAHSLNEMGSRLSESKAELEARVQERTHELSRLADENARLYQEAKNAVKAREEFLSVASHELRNPLTALNLQLQLVEKVAKASANPQIKELSLKSLGQVARLRKLLDELLDLTRLRLDKIELHLEEGDLSSIVFECASDFAMEAAAAGSLITIDAKEPIRGRVDPVRIRQVVGNLISNAIKYGGGRPIEVKLERFWRESDQGMSARIRVIDSGPGIADQDRDRIFERFERVSDTSNKVSGLGLGLYISKHIVEAHGGKISVESAKGGGSVFSVEIPLA